MTTMIAIIYYIAEIALEKIDDVTSWLLDQIGYAQGIIFQYVHNNDLAMMVIPEIKIDQSQYLFMTTSEDESDYTNTCDYKTLFW